MDEYSSHAFNITRVLFVLYLLCGIGFYVSPLIVFAIFQIKEPWLPIYIPFADVTTKEGYMITTCYHHIVIYIAVIGLAFCDALFFNFIFNILTISELQCNQQSKLNEDLSVPKFSIPDVRARMVNFCKMYHEMEK